MTVMWRFDEAAKYGTKHDAPVGTLAATWHARELCLMSPRRRGPGMANSVLDYKEMDMSGSTLKVSSFLLVFPRNISAISNFYRATRMHSADYAVARYLSVRLSDAGILSKRLYISSQLFFSPSGSPTTTEFSQPNGMVILRWDIANGGVECRGITIFDQYLALSRKRCKIEP